MTYNFLWAAVRWENLPARKIGVKPRWEIRGPGHKVYVQPLALFSTPNFPCFYFGVNELICFYNDAYRPSLGKDGKHPSILGMRGIDAWPEIWLIIQPLIDQVLAGGEATWNEDQLIPIYRNGKIEDVYWTFSYSPVNDESGKPAGVFVTCTETTDKVVTR